MKKFGCFLLLLCLLVPYAVGEEMPEEKDFSFLSLKWGQERDENNPLMAGSVEQSDDRSQMILLHKKDFLGFPVEIFLQFCSENTQSPGLCLAAVSFKQDQEEALLAALEEIYGPIQSQYTDDFAFPVPLNPHGWVSPHTFASALTAEEKEAFTQNNAHMDSFRLGAVLRQPLVSLQFDAENNILTFNGNPAACVKHIKAQYSAE